MQTLHYVFYVLAVCYGLLSLFAALVQIKNLRGAEQAKKDSPLLMLWGGIMLPFSFGGWWGVAVALIGCICISVAAYTNGKRSGNFHKSHHIVRALLAAVIVLGLALTLL